MPPDPVTRRQIHPSAAACALSRRIWRWWRRSRPPPPRSREEEEHALDLASLAARSGGAAARHGRWRKGEEPAVVDPASLDARRREPTTVMEPPHAMGEGEEPAMVDPASPVAPPPDLAFHALLGLDPEG
jgi:hypothetical protein